MAIAISIALQIPWLGLRLLPNADGSVMVQTSQAPSAHIPAGAQLLAIAAPGQTPVDLEAEDLMEEPDVLDSHARIDRFFARQNLLATVLYMPAVELRWRHPSDHMQHTTVTEPRQRTIRDLPQLFWFQLVVSVTGCLIACWIWVLRPHDWGARMFGITGLCFPLFAMPAAIYSGRELALPGQWFAMLSAMNHWGSILFGAALVSIFLMHPKPLVRPIHIGWPFALFSLWWWTDFRRIVPNPDLGIRLAVITEMLLAISLAVVQWRRSKGDALGRASLRWLSLSLLLGSGLFIFLIIATATLGWLPPIPQGYAFGFFLFIYVGIALGLRRYRLFNLDEWAYRMLLWVGGALAVVGMDALLIVALDWSASTALGASLWICGALYFPARQWLWQCLAHRPTIQVHELMPDIVRIAFQPSRPTQETLWDDLLRRLHDPLHLESSTFMGQQTHLDDTGLILDIPACGGIAARRLRYAARGQRLFSPQDVAFMNALCHLMDQAQAGRDAHERGASEERRRIARDIHDDVGARLLMLIHRAGSPELVELARAAMHDLRTTLHVMDAQDISLRDAIADWRAEANARCEAAHVALTWISELPKDTVPILTSRQKAVVERALREGLTNALRHAQPHQIHVSIALDSTFCLQLSIRHDGHIGTPQQWTEGRGLRGMRQRLQEYGATLHISSTMDKQAELNIQMPLSIPTQPRV